MNPDRWKQIDNLLQSALERPPEERNHFLRSACAGDEALEAEVQSLLQAQLQAGRFLERPAIEVAAQALTVLGNGNIQESFSEPAEGAARSLPSHIGHYRIISLVGKGGMGEVYRAHDSKLGRDVALKVLPNKFANDPDRLSRFQREAQLLATLNHPNILTIYDVGTHEGSPYVVSEMLEGETLHSRLLKGMLPLRKATDYALQLAKGLAAAHSKGVLHRDLKPENLFLTNDGRVKILDFGLAKLRQNEIAGRAESSARATGLQTEPGVIMGTVGYMSPEQARGFLADHRSDIFSFGVIYYEMICGQRAFKGQSALDILSATANEDPPELSRLKPDIPAALERVVSHCLAKNPDDRFQSARDLVFAVEQLDAASPSSPGTPAKQIKRGMVAAPSWIAIAAVAILAALGGVFVGGRILDKGSNLHFQRLTFRQGTVWSARFAPEGRTVVYSAAWDRQPVELFSTRLDSPESRSLGLLTSDLLALSPSGDMALLFKSGSNLDWGWKWGTLAQASLAGGSPRELLKDVQLADWSPDGATLAIVRLAEGRSRVEFGVGKVIYQTSDRIGALRISPRGDLIGFAERPPGFAGGWSVGIADLKGKKKILSSGWAGEFIDLAWSGSGDEIWFNTRQGGDDSIHGVTLSGSHRILARTAIPLQLLDVSRNGRALVSRIHWRSGILGIPPGERAERDLSWLDASELDDISQEGRSLLITEFGEGGGAGRWSVYLRKTDDSPAVRLGDGQAFALSPDGSRALCLRRTSPPQLILWPTAAGEPISIKNDGIVDYYWGDWSADGKKIIFSAAEPGHRPRVYIQDIEGGKPRPITAEGVSLRVGQRAVSPDGAWVVAIDLNDRPSLYPISGGEPRAIPGLEPGDVPIRWSTDERSLLVFRKSDAVPKTYAVDLVSGHNDLLREIIPADPAGITDIWGVHIGPDDKSYYYSFMRTLSDLYVLDGLK